jgi:N-acetylglutamate synthase-like GNAT family acetyltransferase
MVEMHVIDEIGKIGWYGPIKQFYALVGYHQELYPEDAAVVAMIGDCIVGCCRLCKEHESYTVRGLQVHPHYRGQGIGTQLLKQVSVLLDGQRECYCLPYVYLEKLYNKAGFVRIDEKEIPDWFRERFSLYKSQNMDVIVMKKGKGTSPAL